MGLPVSDIHRTPRLPAVDELISGSFEAPVSPWSWCISGQAWLGAEGVATAVTADCADATAELADTDTAVPMAMATERAVSVKCGCRRGDTRHVLPQSDNSTESRVEQIGGQTYAHRRYALVETTRCSIRVNIVGTPLTRTRVDVYVRLT